MPALQQPPVEEFKAKTLLTALTALKKGDFSVRLPADWEGISGKVADAYDEVVELNARMAAELGRISADLAGDHRQKPPPEGRCQRTGVSWVVT